MRRRSRAEPPSLRPGSSAPGVGLSLENPTHPPSCCPSLEVRWGLWGLQGDPRRWAQRCPRCGAFPGLGEEGSLAGTFHAPD